MDFKCPRGYVVIGGICVPKKQHLTRDYTYASIFNNDHGDHHYHPIDPEPAPEPEPEPEPNPPPTPGPEPDDNNARAGNDIRAPSITIPQNIIDQQMSVGNAIGLSLAGAGATSALAGSLLTGMTTGTATADIIGTAAENTAMMTEMRALDALADAQKAAKAAKAAADAAEAAEAAEGTEGLFEGGEIGIELTSLVSEEAAASAAADAAVSAAAAAAEAATAESLAIAAGEGAALTSAEIAAGVAGDVVADSLMVGLGLAGETMGTSLLVAGAVAGVAGTTALIIENQAAIGNEINKDANKVSQTFDKGVKAIGNIFS